MTIKSISIDEQTNDMINEIKKHLANDVVFKNEMNDSYVIRLVIRYYYLNNVKDK